MSNKGRSSLRELVARVAGVSARTERWVRMFLPEKASRRRLKDAERARANRLEIVKALSHDHITRRDLIRWGLVTTGGLLMPIRGLSPFVGTARADSSIPTGAPPSPGTRGLAFTQPFLRLEVLERRPVSLADGSYNPAAFTGPQPREYANDEDRYVVDKLLGGGDGPLEGRPPGKGWAHQRFYEFPPKIAIEANQLTARVNTTYNGPNGAVIPFKFHPALPTQNPESMWTFNGTVPPKLVMARYGEPILFRHWNRLPVDNTKNGGFGRNTITTHEHNGHNPGESDGFTGAFFFPGQFYDYHWPLIHAGHDTINTFANDKRCGSIDDNGNIVKLPGDWRETMSTHWFHDHMFSFTAANTYKGNAAMLNMYSSVDSGNEVVSDGINLQLPSGSAKPWGNLDYDINLMLADKAWDADGQLFFDIFDLDGFLGDAMTVNFLYKPYFEVEARKYRFRILNASVSRFFKIALSDGSPVVQIGNDGNLLPGPVVLNELDQLGIAERYDIIIDFSRYLAGQKVWLVNLCEHENGAGPSGNVSLADALAGKSADPCVSKFLEFRVVPRTGPDLSVIPPQMIPNPDLSAIPVARTRTFEFGDSDGTDKAPWTINTDGGRGLAADFSRISATTKPGTREIWTLKNGGGDWDHPVHIHFEEGQILARNGSAAKVPPWERGRKDVYRLKPDGSVTITMQFREFMGTYLEHCHNTVHEDNAMLLRWDANGGLTALPTPAPTPQGVEFIPSTGLPKSD
ncbi:MAG TPA: multicopper oxidase domain-containing protein [Gemmatimonadaceae bacterium]